jgi:hypothetical protein
MLGASVRYATGDVQSMRTATQRARVVVAILLSIGSLPCLACSADDPAGWDCHAATGYTCAKTGGAAVQACCTKDNNSCKFIVEGKDYPCDGTDCTQAAADVGTYCSS